jgi:hypothetical protein
MSQVTGPITDALARLDAFADLPDNYSNEGHRTPTASAIETAKRWAPIWLAWGMHCYPSDGGIMLESEPDMIEIQPDGSCLVFDSFGHDLGDGTVLGVFEKTTSVMYESPEGVRFVNPQYPDLTMKNYEGPFSLYVATKDPMRTRRKNV